MSHRFVVIWHHTLHCSTQDRKLPEDILNSPITSTAWKGLPWSILCVEGLCTSGRVGGGQPLDTGAASTAPNLLPPLAITLQVVLQGQAAAGLWQVGNGKFLMERQKGKAFSLWKKKGIVSRFIRRYNMKPALHPKFSRIRCTQADVTNARYWSN